MLKRFYFSFLFAFFPACDVEPGAATAGSDANGANQELSDEMFCQRLTKSACEGAVTPNGLVCDLQRFTPTSMSNGMCELGEPVELCVAHSDEPTPAGCEGSGSCQPGTAFFNIIDGTMMMRHYCGGHPPEGWTACDTLDPQDATPPECGCWCGEGPELTGSTGAYEDEDTAGTTGSA